MKIISKITSKITLKLNERYFRIQFLFFFIGLSILTLGISFVVHSKFGVGPWDLVNLGLLHHFGFTFGIWVNVVSIIQLCICGVIIKKTPRLSTLITAFTMGFFIDFWLFLLSPIPNFNYLNKFILFAIGLFLISVGASFYLISGFPPSCFDYFMVTVKDKFNLSLRKAKILIEFLGLCLGLLLGQWSSIGIGTLFMVFTVGPLIQFFLKYSSKIFNSTTSKYQ